MLLNKTRVARLLYMIHASPLTSLYLPSLLCPAASEKCRTFSNGCTRNSIWHTFQLYLEKENFSISYRDNGLNGNHMSIV